MMNSTPPEPSSAIHAIILTLNEERHIARCIESLRGQCASVTLVDSGSSDATMEIARRLGAEVVSNPWVNHATQFNFGLDQLAGRGGWILRIDADEIVDADSSETLRRTVDRAPDDVDGLLVGRRIHFMGRRIRHGAIEPSWQLRLFRNGRGRCEQRWMDEHIHVAGKVLRCGIVLSDINLQTVSWWTLKHVGYASREAVDILNLKHAILSPEAGARGQASPQALKRRALKEKVYSKLSPGARALIYFLYRYFLRLGFLDGREGFYFHLMQGLWYRVLVDAKLTEILDHQAKTGVSLPEAIKEKTGIAIPS